MNEREMFENGCFSPEWTSEEVPISSVYTRQNKSLETLLSELDEIKSRIDQIKAKQWNLAKLLHFHENNFAQD